MTVSSGARTSPQPANPRRQMPDMPFVGSSIFSANCRTWSQLGSAGILRLASLNRSLR